MNKTRDVREENKRAGGNQRKKSSKKQHIRDKVETPSRSQIIDLLVDELFKEAKL